MNEEGEIENNNNCDIQTKKYLVSESELVDIQNAIHKMNKHNQIEVGKILHTDKTVTLNENRYGIFVNLTELPYNVIEKLKGYIAYSNTQEMTLLKVENEKESFKTKFFSSGKQK